MELVGDGVKLVGEDELVSGSGRRSAAGTFQQGQPVFVTAFTKKYPEVADRSPIYAELRNLIDLAVVAAHIQQQDYYGKAQWKMEFFGNEKEFSGGDLQRRRSRWSRPWRRSFGGGAR